MSGMDNGANAGLMIGRTLELARKEQGLSLLQVEQGTKIRTRYLRELERENFDVLPPVYVQGSLKTYASFLGLDGEALTRELRRRQPPEDAPEPPKTEYLDRYLVSHRAEGPQVVGDEDEAGVAVPAGGSNRLYLVSGAFLVLLIVAIALMVTLARDSQPVVSEVREPLVSQAPSEASSRPGGEEDEPAYRQEDAGRDDPRPEQRAGSPDDARDDGEAAQAPRDATATASAPPATETATAEPEATPQPTAPEPAGDEPTPTRPAPAASEPPAREDQAAVGGPRVGGPRVGGSRLAEPARRGNGGPVKGFSITRERDDRGLIP